jgi:hypothetical protein
MNICLVSQEYPPATARGGIGVQTWNKAKTLVRLGNQVHVLSCAASSQPEPSTIEEEGVTVHRFQPPGADFPVYQTPTYWLGYTWAVLRQLHRLMQTTTFDVLDFPEYGAEGFAYQLDRTPWNWVPVVVQFHGSLAMFAEYIGWPEKGSPFYQTGRFMEEFSVRQADGLMACSASIANFTARFYGVPREIVDVIHVGSFAAWRPAYGPVDPAKQRQAVIRRCMNGHPGTRGPAKDRLAFLDTVQTYSLIMLQFSRSGIPHRPSATDHPPGSS